MAASPGMRGDRSESPRETAEENANEPRPGTDRSRAKEDSGVPGRRSRRRYHSPEARLGEALLPHLLLPRRRRTRRLPRPDRAQETLAEPRQRRGLRCQEHPPHRRARWTSSSRDFISEVRCAKRPPPPAPAKNWAPSDASPHGVGGRGFALRARREAVSAEGP